MANSSSSKKRARQTVKRNKHNSMLSSRMRTMVKKVIYAINSKDKKTAITNFTAMQKALDNAACKGLISKNMAARKKSRLNFQIKAL